jgi:hypothetical protein
MKKHPAEGAVTTIESEDELVARAVEAISQSQWIVGECAATWTRRYARGRTDADFGLLIGLSEDQVYQRRRVWEEFAEVAPRFAILKWSHFYTALGWDDFDECLQWAHDMRATVAEMKAWRRARRGEDLTAEAPDVDTERDPLVQFVPESPAWVQDPASFRSATRSPESGGGGMSGSDTVSVAGVARQVGAGEPGYTPFRRDALQPLKRVDPVAASNQLLTGDQPSMLQLVKRMTTTLERFVKAATPAHVRAYRELPESIRERFETAAVQFQEYVVELG